MTPWRTVGQFMDGSGTTRAVVELEANRITISVRGAVLAGWTIDELELVDNQDSETPPVAVDDFDCLSEGVLTFEQPVLVLLMGRPVDAALWHTLEFRAAPGSPAVHLQLTVGDNRFAAPRSHFEYDGAVADLVRTLPDDVELRICGTCDLGEVGATMTNPSGLYCYRNAQAPFFAIKTKSEWIGVQGLSEQVEDWHHCPQWRKRPHPRTDPRPVSRFRSR